LGIQYPKIRCIRLNNKKLILAVSLVRLQEICRCDNHSLNTSNVPTKPARFQIKNHHSLISKLPTKNLNKNTTLKPHKTSPRPSKPKTPNHNPNTKKQLFIPRGTDASKFQTSCHPTKRNNETKTDFCASSLSAHLDFI
jgi:hypothetical protein